jgi:hypothetical protein
MLKIAEGAFKKKKSPHLLSSLLERLKRRTRRIKYVVSKTNKPTKRIKKDKGTCYHCKKKGY